MVAVLDFTVGLRTLRVWTLTHQQQADVRRYMTIETRGEVEPEQRALAAPGSTPRSQSNLADATYTC
jgi:hypothetical protein